MILFVYKSIYNPPLVIRPFVHENQSHRVKNEMSTQVLENCRRYPKRLSSLALSNTFISLGSSPAQLIGTKKGQPAL